MSRYDFDSDACLHVLQGLLKEIPSGLSVEMMTNIVSTIRTKNPNEAVDQIIKNEEHCQNYAGRLDIWWADFNISDKLKNMKGLASTGANTSISWRPITGKENINAIICVHLEKRKQQWLKEISKLDAEVDSTTKILNDHRKLISKTIQTLDTASTKIVDRAL